MRPRSHRSHVIKTTDEKEKTMKTDFTYGNVFKQLVYFSGPIILANLLQISFQFVDSLWVGNLLGAKALGLCGRLRNGFLYGAVVRIGRQQCGADDSCAAKRKKGIKRDWHHM